MKNKLVKSTAVYWCDEDDRYVLVVKENDDVVGLNYMQGDEPATFEKEYSNIDEDLTDFYSAVSEYLSGVTEIARINQAIWAYASYERLRADRITDNDRKAKLEYLQNKHGL